jgi:uncharacterized protein YyaL (SSP411 family)
MNHLIHETSPYLLQHAHNPVDWHPWGEEALNQARREDKPILLSIGYSACHWCHVMAHECFEHPEIAAIMNRLFVNIKVDREERPDLDKIYQSAHHLLAQRPGGWPLTMFLAPSDLTPFFGGTYFPPQPRHGLPGFPDLLENLADFYRHHRADIAQHTQAVSHALQQLASPPISGEQFSARPLDTAYAQIAESFDEVHGGFGGAPKFPHFGSLEPLLQRDDPQALGMARLTLEKMARGGIYDQLGGGLCRYSTDELWMIPHFEKMLYDNGPFIQLCSQAWQLTGDPLFARVAGESADWAIHEMRSAEGGFYATLDADSEAGEGVFYTWTREQVREILDADEYKLFSAAFGLDRPANFEGRWHLHGYLAPQQLAEKFALPLESVERILAGARQKLFAQRQKRAAPGRDEKILAAWNGLMIKGLAVAGEILRQPAYIEAAQGAVDFIRTRLWRNGRLLAVYKDGQARFNAYLDDHAYLLDALLALLQAHWRRVDLDFAQDLAELLLARFEDPEQGGFFFTADDHEALIQRPKPFGDDSTPAGNGVAALALARLGHLLGETRYLQAAERTLRAAWSSILHLPYAHTSLLLALEEYLQPLRIIVLRGSTADLPAWRAAAGHAPHRLLLAIPNEAQDLPGLLAERRGRERTVAYICSGTECRMPVEELEVFRKEMSLGASTTELARPST